MDFKNLIYLFLVVMLISCSKHEVESPIICFQINNDVSESVLRSVAVRISNELDLKTIDRDVVKHPDVQPISIGLYGKNGFDIQISGGRFSIPPKIGVYSTNPDSEYSKKSLQVIELVLRKNNVDYSTGCDQEQPETD